MKTDSSKILVSSYRAVPLLVPVAAAVPSSVLAVFPLSSPPTAPRPPPSRCPSCPAPSSACRGSWPRSGACPPSRGRPCCSPSCPTSACPRPTHRSTSYRTSASPSMRGRAPTRSTAASSPPFSTARSWCDLHEQGQDHRLRLFVFEGEFLKL